MVGGTNVIDWNQFYKYIVIAKNKNTKIRDSWYIAHANAKIILWHFITLFRITKEKVGAPKLSFTEYLGL